MDKEFMEQIWGQRHYGTPLAIVFMVIPTIAVALRIYAKITTRRPIELSDCLAMVAWTLTIAFFVAMLTAVYLPASFLDSSDGIDKPVSKLTFSLNLLWAGACYFCKLSILCVYHQVLSTPSSNFRLAVRVMFVLTACIGVASCLGFLLIFKDISWWWSAEMAKHPQAMQNELKMNEAIDVMSLLTDVIICVMPLPVLRKLNLDRKKKMALMLLFSLGFLTCLEVIIRIITTYGFNGALDAIQVQCLLMAIEPSMGVTICSLPVFMRLFRKSKSNQSSRYYASTSKGQGNFYPLSHSTAVHRSEQEPDQALLEPIKMEPISKPEAVRINTEITVHSSHRDGYDSVESF